MVPSGSDKVKEEYSRQLIKGLESEFLGST